MTTETKSGLSQIFRQHDVSLHSDQTNQNEQAPVLKPFPLRAVASPFVVSNAYSLQLDEII